MADAKVINLPMKAPARPFVRTVDRVADSATSPYLCRASDGNYYWCKQFENRQGWESVVNEIVASMIGERIGAPVRQWEILDVPEGQVGSFIKDSRIRIGSGPVFGSLDIHQGEVNLMDWGIERVSDDSNYQRIPMLIALWCLTNAQELQVIYDHSAENSIWSIDHGLWFGSAVDMWEMAPDDMKAGRPEIARPQDPIPKKHWDDAIARVDDLDDSLVDEILPRMPGEWQVSDRDIRKLVSYAIQRKSFTKNELGNLRDADMKRLSR